MRRKRRNSDDAIRALERRIFANGDYAKATLDQYFNALERAGRLVNGKDKRSKAFQVEVLAKTPTEYLDRFFLAYQTWATSWAASKHIASAIDGGASREAVTAVLLRYKKDVPLIEFSPDMHGERRGKFLTHISTNRTAWRKAEEIDCVIVYRDTQEVHAIAISKQDDHVYDDVVDDGPYVIISRPIREISQDAISIVQETVGLPLDYLDAVALDPLRATGDSLKLYSLLAWEENALNGTEVDRTYVIEDILPFGDFKRDFAIELAMERRGWL